MSMNENLEDEHNRINLSGFQFNGEMKFVLLKVADVLIPLQKWIECKPFIPNQVPNTLKECKNVRKSDKKERSRSSYS